MKRLTFILLLILTSTLFVSCSSLANDAPSNTPSVEASMGTKESTEATESATASAAESNAATESATATEGVEIPTPYQYLALMAGNAESLSFSYVTTPVEGAVSEGLYERRADMAAASYTSVDGNGTPLDVREMALQDETFFVVPSLKTVYRYEGVVPHLIEAELLAALQGKEGETVLSGETAVTSYTVPLRQDPDTPVLYTFTMDKDGLREVKVFVAGELHRTISFGPFVTEDVPETRFDLPGDLPVESFGYSFDQAQMLPWWDAASSGEDSFEDSSDDSSDASSEGSSDDSSEGGSDDSGTSGLGPIVAWPQNAPDSVPELKNANITAVVPGQGSLTMMFETTDTDLIKAYVEQLGKEGFEQTSLSENKFGLNYNGSHGGVSIFINYVSGGLSKLAIEF